VHGAEPGSSRRHTSGGVAAGRAWVIVQHVAHEGPGLIAEVLDERAIPYEVVRTDRGDPLPDHRSVAGLVVMGGPMGVHDVVDHPWLGPERDLIGQVVEAGAPVVGVCLGAQQLAVVLGAEVTTGPVEEVGIGRVDLTAAGRMDPVTGPEYGGLGEHSIPCVHWHRDTFSMPVGAVHLASSRNSPHQAFRWGQVVYGLQFHIEVDRSLAALWQPHLPPGVALDGLGLAGVETAGRRLLRRLVDRSAPVAAAPGPPVEAADRA